VDALRVRAHPAGHLVRQRRGAAPRPHERVSAGPPDQVVQQEVPGHVLADGEQPQPGAEVAQDERHRGQHGHPGQRGHDREVGGPPAPWRAPPPTPDDGQREQRRERGAGQRHGMQVPRPHRDQQPRHAQGAEGLAEADRDPVQPGARAALQADQRGQHQHREEPVDTGQVGHHRHHPGRDRRRRHRPPPPVRAVRRGRRIGGRCRVGCGICRHRPRCYTGPHQRAGRPEAGATRHAGPVRRRGMVP
jgi:hypothetical protein